MKKGNYFHQRGIKMHLLIALDGADPELARKYFKKIKEIKKFWWFYDNFSF